MHRLYIRLVYLFEHCYSYDENLYYIYLFFIGLKTLLQIQNGQTYLWKVQQKPRLANGQTSLLTAQVCTQTVTDTV